MSTIGKNQIYLQDCNDGLKKIQDKKAQTIIIDPPYNIGKDFGNNKTKMSKNEYIEWCKPWLIECERILAEDGTIFIYGFSEILMHLGVYIENELGLNIRWLVWHYTNKTVPRLNFWQRSHESILCCYRDEKIFNKDEVREPYTKSFLKNAAGKKRKASKGRYSNGDTETVYKAHQKGALPRDVIKVPALAGGAGKKERVNHPTQKPLELCRILLKSCKKSDDDLIVVPFCGSGSECVAAKELNLDFISFEINEKYIKISNDRLKKLDEKKEN